MGTIKYYVRKVKKIQSGTPVDLYIGQNVPVEPISIDQICEEVSHSTTVTKSEVLAIVAELEHQFVNLMRANKSIRFGLLGTFRSTMRSTPARTAQEFLPENIKRINVAFAPSATMRYKFRADNPENTFVLVEPNE